MFVTCGMQLVCWWLQQIVFQIVNEASPHIHKYCPFRLLTKQYHAIIQTTFSPSLLVL